MSKKPALKKTLVKGSAPRKISVRTYVVAGILTFLIFSLGIALGSLFQKERYDAAVQVNEAQDVEYLSLQLQYLLLNSGEFDQNCAVLGATLQRTVGDLSQSLAKILEFEKDYSGFGNEDFTLLSRRYTLDNIRYYLLAEKALESCELEVVPILYFHAEDCDDCATQGSILTYYKKLLGERVLVFPIDIGLQNEEAMVDIFVSLYGVETYPSVVVGGELQSGFVDKQTLGSLICDVQEFEGFCA